MKMPNKQSGVTLLVALIMLIVITMLVITSANLGNSSLQTVSNMQNRNEAVTAAQEALEEVVSSKRFFESPTTVFTTSCNGSYNAKCIDTNGDNTPDVTVTLTPVPTCVQARVMPNSELRMSDPEEAGCATPPAQEAFGMAAPTNNSECAKSIWEIRAVALDNVTQATAAVTQGVSVAVQKNAIDTSCP
jgi:Tfp pilus assembly protein PilX